MDSESIEANQDQLPGGKNRPNKLFLLAYGLTLIAAIAAGWLAYDHNKSDPLEPKASYLTSDRDVLCVNTGLGDLQCENLQTGEIKDIDLPEKYAYSTILPSPDGRKLLIAMTDGNAVVTDEDLNQLLQISRDQNLPFRFPQYSWASNGQVLISEIKYEDNDLAENPAPLVISMLNTDTGEKRRIFKTGEWANVNLINMIGADDEYLFLSMPAAKNWVADSTNPPLDTISAVRLSDGTARQVGTHQIDAIGAGDKTVQFRQVEYDGSADLFLIAVQESDDPTSGKYMVAELGVDEFGLGFRKVKDVMPAWDALGTRPILTSKGLLISGESIGDRVIIDDEGLRAGLNLKRDSMLQFQLFGLRRMPNTADSESSSR